MKIIKANFLMKNKKKYQMYQMPPKYQKKFM